MELKDKKVLLVGLGVLGGGISMANYLLEKGALLTVTDLRSLEDLRSSLKSLPPTVKVIAGRHRKKDFLETDLVLFNPAVPVNSDWVEFTKKQKIPFFNDYTFFMENIKQNKKRPQIIGITGTRGKTTISTWTNYLIKGSVLGGNIPDKNLLTLIDRKTGVFVLELSSFQLEYSNNTTSSPNIAVFSNLYTDHLNRYGNFANYRDIKFKIFENQTEDDFLILNLDEPITKEVLLQKPKAQIFFTSLVGLPKKKNGLFIKNNFAHLRTQSKTTKVANLEKFADHEKSNLLCAIMAAIICGVDIWEISLRIKDLPTIGLRQEEVFKSSNFKIINDSAATSPEATIAAINKFKSKELILITGGTDKQLDFNELAKTVKKDVRPQNLYLLSGSATKKLKHKLGDANEFETLEEILKLVKESHKKGTVLFSPGAASFEKFKNEFDRGNEFNKLVKKYFIQSSKEVPSQALQDQLQ